MPRPVSMKQFVWPSKVAVERLRRPGTGARSRRASRPRSGPPSPPWRWGRWSRRRARTRSAQPWTEGCPDRSGRNRGRRRARVSGQRKRPLRAAGRSRAGRRAPRARPSSPGGRPPRPPGRWQTRSRSRCPSRPAGRRAGRRGRLGERRVERCHEGEVDPVRMPRLRKCQSARKQNSSGATGHLIGRSTKLTTRRPESNRSSASRRAVGTRRGVEGKHGHLQPGPVMPSVSSGWRSAPLAITARRSKSRRRRGRPSTGDVDAVDLGHPKLDAVVQLRPRGRMIRCGSARPNGTNRSPGW